MHTCKDIEQLLANNQAWSKSICEEDPNFFPTLAKQQNPHYLWIGCSDSRVPANNIIGLMPGEVFVHRNVANMVVHTDMNLLSVLQFAVEVLEVKQIIVCGHYGCGGVRAALAHEELGLIDNWLRGIKDILFQHRKELQLLPTEEARVNRLCELNVIRQVHNLCHTTIVQKAWANQKSLEVHGLIYGLQDGLLKDLNTTLKSKDELNAIYRYDV